MASFPFVQRTIARSMSGSSCTSTCWAMMWSLATSKPVTSFQRRSEYQALVCAVDEVPSSCRQADAATDAAAAAATDREPCMVCRYSEKQVGYMACSILMNEVSLRLCLLINIICQVSCSSCTHQPSQQCSSSCSTLADAAGALWHAALVRLRLSGRHSICQG